MQDQLEFTVNGERFIISESRDCGWVWEHMGRRIEVIADEGGFASPAEAQADAMRYARDFERAEREAEEEAYNSPSRVYLEEREQRVNEILGK